MPTKPTLFEWATSPTSPIIYPASAFVTGGYPATYQIPAAEYNATLNRIGEWFTYIDPYIGTIQGDLFAKRIRSFDFPSLQDGVYLPGATYAVELRAFGALGVRITVNTGASTWDFKSGGTILAAGWTSIDWTTGAIRNAAGSATYANWAAGAVGWSMPSGSTTAANATSGFRHGYPTADRPTITYDVSPWIWPTTVQTSLITLSGADILAGSWQLRNDAGGAADLYASAPLPRSGRISDTSNAVLEVVSLAAVGLTKDGTVTEVYVRLRSRSIASWGTTATLASVSSATPTWSGSVVLDESTYVYWLEYFADNANSGSTNGMTVERVTIGIKPYTADV